MGNKECMAALCLPYIWGTNSVGPLFVPMSFIAVKSTCYNESTAGADASVEVPKLHNIKLL